MTIKRQTKPSSNETLVFSRKDADAIQRTATQMEDLVISLPNMITVSVDRGIKEAFKASEVSSKETKDKVESLELVVEGHKSNIKTTKWLVGGCFFIAFGILVEVILAATGVISK